MTFLKKFLGFFRLYANPSEKRVDRFLHGLKSTDDINVVQRRVLEYMKKDLVMFHLWCERRYKGYKYLSTSKRQELYKNVEKITADFLVFSKEVKIDAQKLFQQLEKKGINAKKFSSGEQQEFLFLFHLTQYFSGRNKRFLYQESSNFGELLRDPNHEKLVGDCNQIVTLYAYLFAQRFDISHLQIKIYPRHVCLHYRGVDIEATNGTFQKYQKKDQRILPITELIAVNLLDISDARKKQFRITPEALLSSAKLAFLLSSSREIVENNLSAAYQNIIAASVKNHKYKTALTYARQSRDQKLIHHVAHNATVYFVNRNNFSKAKTYAAIAKDDALKKNVVRSEGIHSFNTKNYSKALTIFQKIHDEKLIAKCYARMFFELQRTLKGIKTVADLKKKKYVLQKMKMYAQRSKDEQLLSHVEKLIEQIR